MPSAIPLINVQSKLAMPPINPPTAERPNDDAFRVPTTATGRGPAKASMRPFTNKTHGASGI
jgi:hypothetical protein